MFPARMSPSRNAPGCSARVRDARDRAPAAGADRATAGGSLVVRVLLVTATAALSTLAVWLVGSGAWASASEVSADAEEILAPPAGPVDGAADIDGAEDEAPGPIAAAVNGLDEVAGTGATSGKAAPGRSAPMVETASVGPETPPDRGSGLTGQVPTGQVPTGQVPTEQAPDELVGRPVEHVLHQARPALEPVTRTAGAVGDAVGSDVVGSGAVGGGAASDDPVSAAIPGIRGDDGANLLSPLWIEEGAELAPPDANPPSSGEKAGPAAEPARVGTASTPSHRVLHGQLRPEQRSAKVVPTGKTSGISRDARGIPADPDAPVIDALDAHPKAGHNAAGAVTDGGSQAGFAVGWYPVATPLGGSSPSKRIPDEDRVRSGTSAPQPGTTPD